MRLNTDEGRKQCGNKLVPETKSANSQRVGETFRSRNAEQKFYRDVVPESVLTSDDSSGAQTCKTPNQEGRTLEVIDYEGGKWGELSRRLLRLIAR